jgi:hypothetical protein
MYEMTHIELAIEYKTAHKGHPWFQIGSVLFQLFELRFYKDFGGWTPDVLKAVGEEIRKP